MLVLMNICKIFIFWLIYDVIQTLPIKDFEEISCFMIIYKQRTEEKILLIKENNCLNLPAKL